MDIRIGNGYDVHALAEGLPLWLGGVQVESPIGCMAALHCAAAVQNCLAVEYHSTEIPWWNDIAIGIDNPIFVDGFARVPEKPGLGIESLNEVLIAGHIHKRYPGQWEDTSMWDNEWANDREWS